MGLEGCLDESSCGLTRDGKEGKEEKRQSRVPAGSSTRASKHTSTSCALCSSGCAASHHCLCLSGTKEPPPPPPPVCRARPPPAPARYGKQFGCSSNRTSHHSSRQAGDAGRRGVANQSKTALIALISALQLLDWLRPSIASTHPVHLWARLPRSRRSVRSYVAEALF